MSLTSLEAVLKDLRKGRMIVLLDEESSDSPASVFMAAEKVASEHVNFLLHHARGVPYLAISELKMQQLGLASNMLENGAHLGSSVGVPIGANSALGVEVSAAGRAHTIRTAAREDAGPSDFVTPGNVLPMKAVKGGVLVKSGHAEASVDLLEKGDLQPVGVFCQILTEEGAIAVGRQVEAFAEKHGLAMFTVAELIASRLRRESLVRRVWEEDFPCVHGTSFKAILYRTNVDAHEHMALVKGDVRGQDNVLVRMHSECLTGDVFSSERCDCGDQLREAIRMINTENRGVIVYMHQEGRGIGLTNKMRAYALQDQGRDTVEANLELGFKEDLRDYGIGAQILRDLGIQRLRLLTNNPNKIIGLEGYGLSVAERIPLETIPHEQNVAYLRTKQKKLGHLLSNLKDSAQEDSLP